METPVILSAVRTPIGKFQGGLAGFSATELGAKVIAEAIRRAALDSKQVDEAILGNVVQAGLGQNPARQAALKGEPLGDKQRDEQVDRGKGRIQFLVTMYGKQVDFAKWYQATLRVGDKDIKASFNQNERTGLRLPDGRFAARNVYVFPLESVPPRGTVTLVVRQVPEQKEILRAAVDLGKMR